MKSLSKNWITEGTIDFEYKKYVLLAYLQEVHHKFSQQLLYPEFSELISHFINLKELRTSQEKLHSNFNKPISSLDFKTMSFNYESIPDSDYLKEITEIIDYSLPLMAEELAQGKSIFDEAEKNISFDHVGIIPIHKREGYFILQKANRKKINVYNYSLSPIVFSDKTILGLTTNYFSSYTLTISRPIEKIKEELLEVNPYLPHPAVYIFNSKIELPLVETYLPVAKRILYASLTT